MRENYYALIVSILGKCSPETAFERLSTGTRTRSVRLTPKDVEDMCRLREQGVTYKEIGYIYGMTMEAVWRRIRSHQAKEAGHALAR